MIAISDLGVLAIMIVAILYGENHIPMAGVKQGVSTTAPGAPLLPICLAIYGFV